MNCNGQITDDEAGYAVLAAMWDCTPEEAIDRFYALLDTNTAEEWQAERVFSAAISVHCRAGAHGRACLDHV